MRTSILRTAPFLLGLLPAAIAWSPAGQPLTLQPQSRLWLEGSSTMRSFECKASGFDAVVDAAGAGAVDAVLAGEKAVRTVDVSVAVSALECGNGTMNDHMRKALKAAQHPTITFQVTSYDLAPAAGAVKGQLTGALTIGGVTKNVTIDASGAAGANGALQVTGAYEVNMREFSLKPPTLMLGTLKVDERVKVSFDLYLKG